MYKLDIPRYYTHLSILLFLIGAILPKSFLKTALLLNSIFVGVMGNIIVIQNIETWSREFNVKLILMSNFVTHTLPMFLSFIILFYCPPENGMASKYLLFLSTLFLLWTTIPLDNLNMTTKVFQTYGIKISVLILIATLLMMGTCKSIEYLRN